MSKVNIFLNKGKFYPGDVIRGKVVCDFKSSKDVRKVSVKLTGEEATHWTEREKFCDHLNRQYKYKQVNYHGDREFLLKSHIVHGEGTMNVGEHVFPFEFTLPGDLPSSFKHHYGKIRFSVKLSIARPLMINYDVDKEITIISPMKLQAISNSLLRPVKYSDEKTIWRLRGANGPIQIEVNLEKRAFIVGENTSIKVNCLNMSSVNVKCINAEIKLKLTFKATHPTPTSYKHDTKIVTTSHTSGVRAHSDRTLNLNLEIPPSTVVPNFKGCELFKCGAELKVRAAISGFHADLDLKIDVALGHTQFLQRLPLAAQSIQSVTPYYVNEVQTMPIRPGFEPEADKVVDWLPPYASLDYSPCPSSLSQEIRTPVPSACETPPPSYEEATKDSII